MKAIKPLVLLLVLSLLFSESKAQTQEILGGNLLNGAITGSLLGTATMGLKNSDDFAPLRIGLGAGILGGAGLIAYDMSTRPSEGNLLVSGFFNEGNNSSIIILLDTVYGAAGGALVGLASMLIADRRVAEGLQYGASAGAWAGFAFGLVDAFFLADRNRDFSAAAILQRESLIAIDGEQYRLGILQPAAYIVSDLDNGSLTRRIEPALGMVSLRFSL